MTGVAHDTLTFTKTIDASVGPVWAALADPDQRAKWSVPAGEAQVYEATLLRLTDQVTSFVGSDMIDGHRNGHTMALDQLQDFVIPTD